MLTGRLIIYPNTLTNIWIEPFHFPINDSREIIQYRSNKFLTQNRNKNNSVRCTHNYNQNRKVILNYIQLSIDKAK